METLRSGSLLCVALLLVLFNTTCKKNPATPLWLIYNTTNSKLPDDQVNAIVIDKNDVKWIGTSNGLLSVDKDKWTVFNSGNSGMPSSVITALTEGKNGAVWVGTDHGLARYSGSGWQVFDKSNSILHDDFIICLSHDQKNNDIWVGTAEGLIKIDKDLGFSFRDLGSELPLSIAIDHEGTLWFSSFNHSVFNGRISRLKNDQILRFKLEQLGYESTFPHAIAMDKHNNPVVVLSGTSVRSVIWFNNNGWTEIERPDNGSAFKVLALEGDKIWLGGNSLSVFGSRESPGYLIPAANSSISAIAIDRAGRKWLGTTTNGLAIFKN